MAVTVPVIAPVLAFGALSDTLAMTGEEFVTAAVAAGAASWTVDTVTEGATTVLGASGSRRAAARTIHDTGDSTGTPVPEPSNGEGTEPTEAVAGAATMTGAAAAGATETGAVMTSEATDAPVAGSAGAAAATLAARSIREDRSGETLRNAESDTATAGPEFGRGLELACCCLCCAPPPRPNDAVDATRPAGRPARFLDAEAGASDWAAESAVTGESDVSAGVAQANPAPPETTAAPIPSATARPPTRPTWADARITLNSPDRSARTNLQK